MARNFGRLLTSIWDDDDWLSLSGNAQRVYMLLLSQRQLSLAGALDVMPRRWARYANDTNVSEVETGLAELHEARFVVIDSETDELVIRTLAAHDLEVGRISGKVAKGFWSAWGSIMSRPLRRVVVQHLPESVWLRLKAEAPPAAEHIRRSFPIDRQPPPPNGRGSNFPSDSDRGSPIESNGSHPTDTKDDAPFEREPSPPSDWLGAPPNDCPSPSPVAGHPPPSQPRESEPADDTTEPTADEEPERKRSGRRKARPKKDHHQDSERLCSLLADSIADRGSTRPPVTERWLDEMDRTIRIDGREPERVEGFIRWLAEGSHPVAEWWQPAIRSPHKLRAQWDQVREQRDREDRKVRRGSQPGSTATTRAWKTTQDLLDQPGYEPPGVEPMHFDVPSLRVVGE